MLSYFFPKPSTREIIRDHQRTIRRAGREIERSISEIKNEEKKMTSDMKAKAKMGEIDTVRIMARDIAHKRSLINQMSTTQMRLNAIHSQLTLLKVNEPVFRAMIGTTQAVSAINRHLKLPELQRSMMEFEKQNEMLKQTMETMDDTISDTMSAPEETQVSESMVQQIMEEISISVENDLISVPSNNHAVKTQSSSSNVQILERQPIEKR